MHNLIADSTRAPEIATIKQQLRKLAAHYQDNDTLQQLNPPRNP